ncbi:lamin tail domain-containing protein, partial [Methanomethylovorans sp.]|uniref:lamin tail domain-containing protein n=1 Tax=Methanomethylovorans sp. TaxID=2758717 RepID=UPI001BD6BFB1
FTQSPNDPNTYIFSWTPGPGTARSYPYRVTFIATSSDGYDDEDEDVRIFVREVDKTTLLNTILSATGKIASVVPGNEVGQYPQASIDAFRIAIDTARRVADDPTATQNQVNDAVIALNNAEAIFDAARITSIDKSALTVAIAAANTKVTTASPGTGIGQYPQVAIDAFRIAIDTAQGVVDDPNATIAEVSQAVTDLKAAEDTFDASRQMPPASVTDLRETATGTNWIHWEWTNPTDADFSHVMVYIDGVFVTTTPNNYYNATGFLEGTVHAIGIQTVDTAGNINPATMTDQATTRTIDRTPPAPVTDLYASSIGESWIHWTWTNPNDADFSHVRIYIDGTFVTTTPSNSYNATGLSNGAEHTIAIETVDTSGNVNTAQVSDTAITLKLPVISLVAGKNIRATSITLEWVASEETATVQISVNGTHLDTVTGSTYVHNDLNESTTYNYTLVPFNQNGLKGEAISISLATSSSSGGGSSGGSSTSIDKSELTAAIAAANTKVTTASPGTGIGQYPQAAIDAFRIAINTAQGVVDDPNATIAEVIQAITDLKAAEATFDASRQIPPASVTDLRETATGTNWIHWEWTNPPDADFDHVKIYIDDAFVTTTPSNSYNATGFTEGTVHTIGIQTVDTVGNINPTMVTDQATTMTINTTDTTPPASVTDLRETATGTNWIHWEWTNPADADFSHVMVYLDNVFVTNTSNGSYYATGLGDVYISDLNLKDEWVKIMNSGSFAVDLTGWEIKDEGDLHTYKFPSFQLGAGEAVTLYTTKGTNTGTELYWGSGGFVWNDDGDTAYLYNSGGYLLDSLKGGATHTMKATSHVLSTRTVDISGNINTTWVNDSATTSSSSSSGSSGGS